MDIEFGQPVHGWLPFRFFEHEWVISRVPSDPISDLLDALVVALHGREAEFSWQLEPEKWTLRISSDQTTLLRSPDWRTPSWSAQPVQNYEISSLELARRFWRALRRLENDWTEEHARNWRRRPLPDISMLRDLLDQVNK